MNLAINKDNVSNESMREHTAKWMVDNIDKAEDAIALDGTHTKIVTVLAHWQDEFKVEHSVALEGYRITAHGRPMTSWMPLEKCLDRVLIACFRDNDTDD